MDHRADDLQESILFSRFHSRQLVFSTFERDQKKTLNTE